MPYMNQLLAADLYTMSAGRLGAFAGGLLGLAGLVIGGLALLRPAGRFGTGTGRLGATIALAAGLIGMAIGAVVVATSDAGIGTGNGRGGAYVALLLGFASILLGARASLVTRRRSPATHSGARRGRPEAEPQAPRR